ncbi:hypothetical protein RRG08_012651 [Elysia crispata]|uniref:Uncharacterized protein n=1 Tax=Elysia crispata TaxID=231223 RepID=A0AAE1D200_9GAST|nr:hypothetical protein RRG08_012651 [Elysia crispata]
MKRVQRSRVLRVVEEKFFTAIFMARLSQEVWIESLFALLILSNLEDPRLPILPLRDSMKTWMRLMCGSSLRHLCVVYCHAL